MFIKNFLDNTLWIFDATIFRFIHEHPYMTIAFIAGVNFLIELPGWNVR
jgi:hypothetical protein